MELTGIRAVRVLPRVAWGVRRAWAIPVIVVVGLSLPLFGDSTFGNDWPAHLWLVWKQGQAIAQLGHPSYFVQASAGVFEPLYAFYGGTFYAFTGGISALLGQHPTVAYVAVIIAAFAGAYAGWTWLAKQLGVRGWLAQMPGLIYVTAPYVITNSFGRGDVPEFVGTSAIPMVAASALAVLRAERVSWRLGATMVLSVMWFSACHNITTLWGSTLLVLSAIVVLVAVGGPARVGVGTRRIGAVLGLAGLGGLINAWYLFPTLAYSEHTAIALGRGLSATEFDSLARVFSPLRNVAPEVHTAHRNGAGWLDYSGTFDVQTPVLALAWALAVLAICWRRLSWPWRRFVIGMALILAGTLYLITSDMSGVPRPWEQIQFPYRAQTYATLGVCALVLAGTVAVTRARSIGVRRAAMGALAAIAAISFVQALVQQREGPSSLPSRSYVFQPGNAYPPSWYAPFDYADAALRPDIGFPNFVAIPGATGVGGNFENVIGISVDGQNDRASTTFTSPGPGKPIDTQIYGGPEFIKVDGARVAGRSPSNQLAIEATAPKGQIDHVVFSTAHTFPVVLGWLVSILSILTCLLLTAWACWRALRRRSLRDRLGDAREAARRAAPFAAWRRP